MRKIDENNHQRFITALERMVRDLDAFGFIETADDLVISRDELEGVYREYNKKIEEINLLIRTYHDLFGEKHWEYQHASRLRQKEHTRIRRDVLKQEKRELMDGYTIDQTKKTG